MRISKYLFLSCIFSLSIASCIDEYKLPEKVSKNNELQLVVEGHVLAGSESIVYLSYTVPFGQVERPEAILNAKITIVGQNGYESELAAFDIENDRYYIPTHDLPMNTLYALKVEVDGEIYQSEFEPIQKAKEIDEVYYKENETDITIHVSSHGNEEDSPYYIWTYEEDWEIHPSIDVSRALPSGYWSYSKSLYPDLVIGGDNPYINCWGHNNSSLIHIYSTTNLMQNSIKAYELLSIPLDDVKLSDLYSILVKQMGLNEKSYEFFRLQRLYSEQSGGLFTPMPTEIKGNVQCLSNPDKKVFGYVIFSQVIQQRIFIDSDDLVRKSDFETFCSTSMGLKSPTIAQEAEWIRLWTKEKNENGAFIWYANEGEMFRESSIIYSRTCVDCRAFPGATKKRPDFWPNNHE